MRRLITIKSLMAMRSNLLDFSYQGSHLTTSEVPLMVVESSACRDRNDPPPRVILCQWHSTTL